LELSSDIFQTETFSYQCLYTSFSHNKLDSTRELTDKNYRKYLIKTIVDLAEELLLRDLEVGAYRASIRNELKNFIRKYIFPELKAKLKYFFTRWENLLK
jgi:hypothetical protein